MVTVSYEIVVTATTQAEYEEQLQIVTDNLPDAFNKNADAQAMTINITGTVTAGEPQE